MPGNDDNLAKRHLCIECKTDLEKESTKISGFCCKCCIKLGTKAENDLLNLLSEKYPQLIKHFVTFKKLYTLKLTAKSAQNK